jgi:cytochrome c-type protein NapC
MFEQLSNLIKKWFPTASLAGLLLFGIVFGASGIVAFNFTLEQTNTEAFCTDSCHEMTDNVAKEFRGTSHDTNSSGVRATCSDCHVPKIFGPKIVRKIYASLEVYHHILGTIDTPEKFEDHRLLMADRVWRYMKESNSRECRTCHDEEKMNITMQDPEAAQFHQDALSQGKTCIDCHKGIAHKLPREILEKMAEAEAAATDEASQPDSEASQPDS